MFPNPTTNGQLNIELTYTPTEELTLIITDLNGVEKVRRQIQEKQNSIQIDLNSGTYLVKIISSDFRKVIRVIVNQ
ncbi:MAG: T9SS type A sorting domain-containing protein [Cytophagales bacterium]|nr:T9SS type A sorting domain-containing protein [Cytophagales bacterium]